MHAEPDSDFDSYSDAETSDEDCSSKQKVLSSNEEQIYGLNRMTKEIMNGDGNNKPHVVYRHRRDSDSGRKAAIEIFPDEVWRIILGKLSDPQDLWRCFITCELFADILSKWRAGWIMEIALPHMYRHLSKSKLLKCRLVCTGWNKKINSFLEDHPSLRPHDSKRDPRRLEFVNPVLEKQLYKRNTYNFNFLHSDYIPHFNVAFTGNPFLGRYVTLMMWKCYVRKWQNEQITKFYDEVYSFLESYGKEIFYLNFEFEGDCNYQNENGFPLERSKFIQLVTMDLFHLVPNLRKLRINGFVCDVRENWNISPESLPPAPKLDSLELDYNAMKPIAHSLMLGFRTQLKMLHVRSTEWNEELSSLDWPLLTELNIRGIGKGWNVNKVGMRTPSLLKLGLVVPDLLSYIDDVMKGFCELSSVTRLDTLRLIGLDAKGYQGFNEIYPISSWSAPTTLETLELKFDGSWGDGPEPYDMMWMLKHFVNVRNLHIFSRPCTPNQSEVRLSTKLEWCTYLPRTKEEIVEVNKFLGRGADGVGGCDMYRSNIWEMVPRLNVFTFQWDVYTRNRYEEYPRKKNLGCDVKSTINAAEFIKQNLECEKTIVCKNAETKKQKPNNCVLN